MATFFISHKRSCPFYNLGSGALEDPLELVDPLMGYKLEYCLQEVPHQVATGTSHLRHDRTNSPAGRQRL